MCPFLLLVDIFLSLYDIHMLKRKTILLLLPLLLSGCGETPKAELTYYSDFCYGVFHSYVSWIYGSDGEDFSKEINSYLEKLDDLADPYYPMVGQSNLYTLNKASDWVSVDPMLYDLLKVAVDLKEKTEGYFNPYIGKITKIWKDALFGDEDAEETPRPTQSDINSIAASIPYYLDEMKAFSLDFDDENYRVKRNGTARVDLGGLVKGYAVEHIEEMMAAHNVSVYKIDGGQSSIGLGDTKSGNPYSVSLMYSKEENENVFHIKDLDTSGSGVYEQKYVLNGKIYNHIVNPITGMPLSDYSMAFLVGENSSIIDAFATACMLAGPDKADEWSKKYGFYYSLYSDKDGYTDFVRESEELTAMRVNK